MEKWQGSGGLATFKKLNWQIQTTATPGAPSPPSPPHMSGNAGTVTPPQHTHAPSHGTLHPAYPDPGSKSIDLLHVWGVPVKIPPNGDLVRRGRR